MSSEVKINSNESEGAFTDYINDQLDDMLEDILTDADLSERGSDIIVEMDDITPPRFSYGDQGGGQGGGGNEGPGGDAGKITFSLPFKLFMDKIAQKLQLPNLVKEGEGRIKEVSYEFKTFGPSGVILDRKRTFKRALKNSIGQRLYDPENGNFDIQVRRKDKRFKLPERIEKPKFKAVVFYMGDISYSTYGARLELEKRLINFIHAWLDFNYGENNVDHRFFVHDSKAYEVLADDFYKVSNAGGTEAACVFDLVNQIAYNEYDVDSTNFYAFYFGDGELFESDTKEIVRIIDESMKSMFNRIGIVEVKPSRYSFLKKMLIQKFGSDQCVKVGEINNKEETLDIIKTLFSSIDTVNDAHETVEDGAAI